MCSAKISQSAIAHDRDEDRQAGSRRCAPRWAPKSGRTCRARVLASECGLGMQPGDALLELPQNMSCCGRIKPSPCLQALIWLLERAWGYPR